MCVGRRQIFILLFEKILIAFRSCVNILSRGYGKKHD